MQAVPNEPTLSAHRNFNQMNSAIFAHDVASAHSKFMNAKLPNTFSAPASPNSKNDPIDFCGKIQRRNLALAHGHVAHLGSFKIDAVTDCVYPFVANHPHGPVNVYVSLIACDSHMRGC